MAVKCYFDHILEYKTQQVWVENVDGEKGDDGDKEKEREMTEATVAELSLIHI